MKNKTKHQMYSEPAWITGNKKVMIPSQMEDRHLINCMRLLERQALQVKAKYPGMKLHSTEIAERVWPVYGAMKKELEKRLNGEPQPTTTLKVKRRYKFD